MRKQLPELGDRDFVCSIAGSVNDRGHCIGFGFRKDGVEMWMVERSDKTVFCAPRVQLARVWRADCLDGYVEHVIRNVHAEGSHAIVRLTKPG